MDEQPALGTILFHVALLAIIVLLVDERLIRGALAIIPAMLIAQRALGATQAKSTGDWTEVHDRRMDLHVREHVTKLLGRFRDFYAMVHLVSSGGMTSDEAMARAGELEMDLNRLLEDITVGPDGEEGPPRATLASAQIGPELTVT
jgi:hypothetical protein